MSMPNRYGSIRPRWRTWSVSPSAMTEMDLAVTWCIRCSGDSLLFKISRIISNITTSGNSVYSWPCYVLDVMYFSFSFIVSDFARKKLNRKHSIGIYCNGCKSGSMRLGQDAIVLSKSNNDVCWHAVRDLPEEDLSQAHGCAYHQL